MCAVRIGIMERQKPTCISKNMIIAVTVLLLAILKDTEAQHDFYKMPGATKCVALVNITLSWYDARTYCAGISAELGKIKSQTEQDFYNAILFGKLHSYWTQMNDLAQEGVYVFPNGDPMNYTAWAPGEPNADGDCVRVMAYKLDTIPPELLEDGAEWTDKPCTNQYYFACEREEGAANETCLNFTMPTTTTEPLTTTSEPLTTTTYLTTEEATVIEASDHHDIQIEWERNVLITVAAVLYVGVPVLIASLLACRYCFCMAGGKRKSSPSPDEQSDEFKT